MANQQAIIKFIKKNLINRFSLLGSITTNQGTMFIDKEMKEFTREYGFSLIHSTLYYEQVNGQVEATNKSLILNIQKMVQHNPREWHKLLL